MEHRQLGRSGLRVSALGLGTMGFGGAGKFANVGELDVQAAGRQIDLCLDAGVTFVDTANVYSQGASEEIVGKAIARAPRPHHARHQGALLDGRRAQRRRPLAPPHHQGRARTACAASAPTGSTSTRSTSGTARRRSRRRSSALDTLVRARQGPLRRLLELRRLADVQGARHRRHRRGYQPFVSNQVYYSLQARDAEYEIVPAALDQGVGLLIWSPLAGGLLSGKYRRGVEAPAGLAPADRVGRAAGPRPGRPLRHRRGAGRDRRGARRLRRPGRAGLDARPPRRHAR